MFRFRMLSYALVLGIAAVVVFVFPAQGSAQGTITDGNAVWDFLGGPTHGSNDFQPDGGTDHQFQTWWWFRVEGASSETAFDLGALNCCYAGNLATFNFSEALFDAVLTTELTDGVAAGAASTVQVMTLTNTSANPLTINIFCYVDFDMSGTFGNDSAILLSPDIIEITDASTPDFGQFQAVNFDHYQVLPFATLRTLLLDNAVTNLNDSGLPFGSADFTAAVQWTLTIDPGASEIFTVSHNINQPPPVLLDTFIRGDCNNDGSYNIADPIYLLVEHLFPGGDPPAELACEDAGDANDDTFINIADGVYMLFDLFDVPGSSPPPSPFPDCGVDPTKKDDFDCETFDACP